MAKMMRANDTRERKEDGVGVTLLTKRITRCSCQTPVLPQTTPTYYPFRKCEGFFGREKTTKSYEKQEVINDSYIIFFRVVILLYYYDT